MEMQTIGRRAAAAALSLCVFGMALSGCGGAGQDPVALLNSGEGSVAQRLDAMAQAAGVCDIFLANYNWMAVGAVDGVPLTAEGTYTRWQEGENVEQLRTYTVNDTYAYSLAILQDGAYYSQGDDALTYYRSQQPTVECLAAPGEAFWQAAAAAETTALDEEAGSCTFTLEGSTLAAAMEGLELGQIVALPEGSVWSGVSAQVSVTLQATGAVIMIDSTEMGAILLHSAAEGAEAECTNFTVSIDLVYSSSENGEASRDFTQDLGGEPQDVDAAPQPLLLGDVMQTVLYGAPEEEPAADAQPDAAPAQEPDEAEEAAEPEQDAAPTEESEEPFVEVEVEGEGSVTLTAGSGSVEFSLPTEIPHYTSMKLISPDVVTITHDEWVNGRTMLMLLEDVTPETYFEYYQSSKTGEPATVAGHEGLLHKYYENDGDDVNFNYIFATDAGNGTLLAITIDGVGNYPDRCYIDDTIVETVLNHCTFG